MKKRILFLHFSIPTLDREYWKRWDAFALGYGLVEPASAWVAEHLTQTAETLVVDCDFYSDEEVWSFCKDFAPDTVGFSCFTAGYNRAQRFADQMSPKIQKVFGGWHVTLPKMAAQVLERNPGSIAVTGRGEGVARDIFLSPGDFIGQVIDGNKVNGARRFPFNVSIKMSRAPYFSVFGAQPIAEQKTASIVLRGGCTFGCKYCQSRLSGLAPERQVEEIIDEIRRLVTERKVNFLFLRDEDPFLPAYQSQMERLCEQLCSTGLNKRVRLHCFADARLTKQPFIRMLAEAGFVVFDIGVESVTPEGRQNLGRTQHWPATCQAFEIIRNEGIFSAANIILWGPEANLDEFDHTLTALKELQPDEVNCLYLTPFPGMSDGVFDDLPKREVSFDDYHLLRPMLLGDVAVTDDELVRYKKEMMTAYYASSEYARLMRSRRQQFGDARFKELTALRRERFMRRHEVDIWQM